MRPYRLVSLALLAVGLPAYAATPVPDPRLDPYYNSIAIADINRSVMLERTMPPMPDRPKPAVREDDMRQVRDGVFIERTLLPRSGQGDDERAIRVFPKDAR